MVVHKRKLGCCDKLASFLAFFLNFLVMIASTVFIGFGLHYHLSPNSGGSLGLGSTGLLLLSTGTATFVATFLGLCAVGLESRRTTRVFSVIIVVCLLVQIGCGIGVLLQQTKIQDQIHSNWTILTPEQRQKIQHKLNCCGLTSIKEDPKCPDYITKSCGDTIESEQKMALFVLSTISFCSGGVSILVFLLSLYLMDRYGRKEAVPSTLPKFSARKKSLGEK